jgi:hypothetical protein
MTRALLEKEIRRYTDKGKDVPEQLSDQATHAAKKYVKEYLARHNIIEK